MLAHAYCATRAKEDNGRILTYNREKCDFQLPFSSQPSVVKKPRKLKYFYQSDADDQTANDNAIKLTQQALRAGRRRLAGGVCQRKEKRFTRFISILFCENSNIDVLLRSACSVSVLVCI